MISAKQVEALVKIAVQHDLDFLKSGEVEIKRRAVEVIQAKAQAEKDAKKLELEIAKQTGRRVRHG